MPRCEDFPCCGHELGCCPDFDEAGRQLNMKCVCGATVPLGGSSLCQSCLSRDEDGNLLDDDGFNDRSPEYDDDDDDDDFDNDDEIDSMEDQHVDGMYEE